MSEPLPVPQAVELHDLPVVPLSKAHDLSAFTSSEPVLDNWLRQWALAGERNGSARTHVLAVGERVLAYYSLSNGSVSAQAVDARVSQGCGGYPVPMVLLARLAVDRSVAGRGVGTRLVLNAGVKVVQAADSIGVRALFVDALHAQAASFYGKLGFRSAQPDECPEAHQSRMLYLLVKDLRATLRQTGHHP